MRVIVDRNGLQARVHLFDGKRLATFLALLRSIPACEVTFSPEGPLAADTLAAQDILVITTRKGENAVERTPHTLIDWLRACRRALRAAKPHNTSERDLYAHLLDSRPYAADELVIIADFVYRGGGLWLLSNHGDVPRLSPHNMTQNDAILARQFGIEIENTFFANPDPKSVSEMSGPDLLATHPIIQGAAGEAPIHSVVTNNCCSIVAANGVPLVHLTHRMVDHRRGWSFQDRCFAIAVENSLQSGGGRVVATADSGFIGAEGTTFPGIGLIAHGDNARFVLNVVRWLGRAL